MCRCGSARQFQTAWMVDFSAWMAGFITDWSTSRPWGKSSSAGGDGGHSLSLFKRAYYTAFTQGASQLTAEAGAVNYFFQNFSSDGVREMIRGFPEEAMLALCLDPTPGGRTLRYNQRRN